MKAFYRICVFIGQFITLGLAAAFLVSVVSPRFVDRVRQSIAPAAQNAPPANPPAAPATVTQSAPDHHSESLPDAAHGDDLITASYSAAVSRAAPAVVNIYANKVVNTRQVLVPSNPVFQRMFPGIVLGPVKQRQQSLGSGVIVSADGYVVTNNHVIQGAEEIAVVLYDGRVTRAMRPAKDHEIGRTTPAGAGPYPEGARRHAAVTVDACRVHPGPRRHP